MYDILIALALIGLGYFVGTRNEKNHYKYIKKMENELNGLPLVTSQSMQEIVDIDRAELVEGNVVIAKDYFKAFVAGLRNMFGGRLASYESLMDRGRREAMIRMKIKARERGANIIINTRLETANIGMAFEVLAYGTAVYLKK